MILLTEEPGKPRQVVAVAGSLAQIHLCTPVYNPSPTFLEVSQNSIVALHQLHARSRPPVLGVGPGSACPAPRSPACTLSPQSGCSLRDDGLTPSPQPTPWTRSGARAGPNPTPGSPSPTPSSAGPSGASSAPPLHAACRGERPSPAPRALSPCPACAPGAEREPASRPSQCCEGPQSAPSLTSIPDALPWDGRAIAGGQSVLTERRNEWHMSSRS